MVGRAGFGLAWGLGRGRGSFGYMMGVGGM